MAVAAYLAAAVVWGGSGAPLFDGLAPPPPYRWSNPPPERRDDNERPVGATGEVVFENGESKPASIGTADVQATVVFPHKGIEPRDGETAVSVRVQPVDPETLGPPPEGLVFDGNAYRVTAVYASSRQPAVLTGPAQLILRYATHAQRMLAREGASWRTVKSSPYPGSLLLAADMDALGSFVPAARGDPRPAIPPWAYVAAGAALAVAVGGLLGERWRRERRAASRRPARRPSGRGRQASPGRGRRPPPGRRRRR